jgi:cysteine desulfurase/selenocysteine lyase
VIYLDNAATTFPKPPKVTEEISRCLSEYCANPGRGGHEMSMTSGRAVMEARETIANFFNIQNSLQLCFTKNATEGLNIAIQGALENCDHVITTCMEHNSVFRPLKSLERERQIEITIVRGDEFGELDLADIRNSIQKNTKMIICTLSSNVNGIINPIQEIGQIAREHGILFLLDGSQGAGSIPIDVLDMNVDMLAFPGHKGLLGPQGTGGLYVKDGLKISSLLYGGTGSHSENPYQPEDMPDLMESGTLNTPGIVGLRWGIEYINSIGIRNIHQRKFKLVQRLYEGLAELPGIKFYSKNSPDNNSGIVALNFEGIASTEISYILDKNYQIETRAGLHCAPLAHETLGTIKTGLVRFSVGCFNTEDEIDFTIKALREISANLAN